jgi:hypothetical protein
MNRTLVADENAQALSIDFLVAIGIFLGAFLFVYGALSVSTTAFYSRSAELTPVAHRVAEILIDDPGEPVAWDARWIAGNYSGVTRIGLSDRSKPNVLNRTKLDVFMITNGTWWQFGEAATNGTKTISTSEYENATAALGLKGKAAQGFRGYDCYLQVRPTNVSLFDATAADDQFRAVRSGISGDVVIVERIVIVPERSVEKDYAYYYLEIMVW